MNTEDLTPQSIFEDIVAKHAAEHPDIRKKINAVYQFELTGDGGGTWVVDLTKDKDFVSTTPHEDPGIIATMKVGNFMSMIQGKLKPQTAFMTGRLKIKGDLGLALKLKDIFGVKDEDDDEE